MATREIPRGEWPRFFDRLTREHGGDRIRVEVLRDDVGAQIEVSELPLDGITADLRKDATIHIAAGIERDNHIMHVVTAPTRVMLKQSDLGLDEVLEIEATDRSTTLVYLGV